MEDAYKLANIIDEAEKAGNKAHIKLLSLSGDLSEDNKRAARALEGETKGLVKIDLELLDRSPESFSNDLRKVQSLLAPNIELDEDSSFLLIASDAGKDTVEIKKCQCQCGGGRMGCGGGGGGGSTVMK